MRMRMRMRMRVGRHVYCVDRTMIRVRHYPTIIGYRLYTPKKHTTHKHTPAFILAPPTPAFIRVRTPCLCGIRPTSSQHSHSQPQYPTCFATHPPPPRPPPAPLLPLLGPRRCPAQCPAQCHALAHSASTPQVGGNFPRHHHQHHCRRCHFSSSRQANYLPHPLVYSHPRCPRPYPRRRLHLPRSSPLCCPPLCGDPLCEGGRQQQSHETSSGWPGGRRRRGRGYLNGKHTIIFDQFRTPSFLLLLQISSPEFLLSVSLFSVSLFFSAFLLSLSSLRRNGSEELLHISVYIQSIFSVKVSR